MCSKVSLVFWLRCQRQFKFEYKRKNVLYDSRLLYIPTIINVKLFAYNCLSSLQVTQQFSRYYTKMNNDGRKTLFYTGSTLRDHIWSLFLTYVKQEITLKEFQCFRIICWLNLLSSLVVVSQIYCENRKYLMVKQ